MELNIPQNELTKANHLIIFNAFLIYCYVSLINSSISVDVMRILFN